jgi:ferredoxin-NADP reductase
VLGRFDRAPEVIELEVEREGLVYSVGDCTLLVRGDRIDSRPYSFSSHPDEPNLRFLVRTISGAPSERSFSQWLSGLAPGDELGVGTPFGWFRPGQSDHEVWFATGTGVSPFLAALRADRPVVPRVFCIGVRNAADAVLRSWVEARAPVRWAFSRFTEAGQTPQRVTQFAAEVPIAPEIRYFLCGNQRMIRSVAEILCSRGVLRGQIHEELFFQ